MLVVGYIEDYLKKSPQNLSEEDVTKFVSSKLPESLTLEYKSGEYLDRADNLSIVITSFANSVGGLLLIGVSEDRKTSLPQAVEWIDQIKFPKEKVENLLLPRIHPRISNVRIGPVSNGKGGIVYLIDIPQGDNPPYMAGDKRYYKRVNFSKIPMEGYEVADYFGRRRRPKLSLIGSFEAVGGEVGLSISVMNTGKAAARDLFIVGTINGGEIINVEGGHKENSTTMTMFFSAPLRQPFYPHPSLAVKIGRVILRPTDVSKATILTYNLMSENMPAIGGGFLIMGGGPGSDTNPVVKSLPEQELGW